MQIERKKGYSWKLSLFFGGIFIPFGIYIPYFAVWLRELGFGAQEISLILTIPLITRVLFTPIMGGLADRLGDRSFTLKLYTSLYLVSFAAILLVDDLIWICVIMVISNLFQSAILPISDSLAMAGVRRYGLDYGRMRLWGSSAFIFANLAGGAIIAQWSADTIIWMMVIGNILQAMLSFFLPVDPRLIDGQVRAKQARIDWSELSQFAQRGFWVVLIAASLLQASHAMLYGFGTIFWQDLGIDENTIGVLWAVSVIVEIGFFMISKKIASVLTWQRLFMIGAAGACLRWGLFPFEFSVEGYFLLQMLHGASFAAAHLGIMFFLSEFIDDTLSATGQGLYTMASGLLMALATMASGQLYALWQGEAFYLMLLLSVLSFVLVLGSKLIRIERIAPLRASQSDISAD
ncbi:MAG: MFS transporter [Cohaesibacter sp.]|jgi:PPP family 3-phenylpropionic acid transporter|nr:MFS transporter [Cohaesibacter sp.]